jgi:protein pelota
VERIILGSPAFWKEYVLKELPDDLRKRTLSSTVSSVSEAAINELLKNPDLGKALESDRVASEEKVIEELMRAIHEDKAFYGLNDSEEKINMGAASKVLVSEQYLKKSKEEGIYKKVDVLLRNAESTGAEIIIITQKQPQTKLESLGGIAGILRWKV